MATAPIAMDPHTVLAISKAVTPKPLEAARAAVQAGTTEISRLVLFKGTLIVGFDTPAGPAGEKDGSFDPWLLLQLVLDRKGAPSIDTLAKWAAEAKEGVIAQTPALKTQFELRAATLLPKVVVPGAAGKRGAVSFAGTFERKA